MTNNQVERAERYSTSQSLLKTSLLAMLLRMALASILLGNAYSTAQIHQIDRARSSCIGVLVSVTQDGGPKVHENSSANTTTLLGGDSQEDCETGRVKLSGVQDHSKQAQIVGG